MIMIVFVGKMSKNADLFTSIKRDWTGIRTVDTLFGSSSGQPDLSYFPFGDVVILDANLTKTGAGVPKKNNCPDQYVPLSR